jgi:hypothetical protein
LTGLTDVQERVGRVVPLDDRFELVAPPPKFKNLDFGRELVVWQHAYEVAKVIAVTYHFAYKEYWAKIDDPGVSRWFVGYAYECCRMCERLAEKPYGSKRPPAPFHVGCCCYVGPDRDGDEEFVSMRVC